MTTTTPKPPVTNERRVIVAALWIAIDRLRAKQASWRFRLFAPWWERDSVQHALVILLREVEK